MGQGKQGISLGVQWLGPHAPNSGSSGSVPGQEIRSHLMQLKILQSITKKIPNAINKTQHSQIQINKYSFKRENAFVHDRGYM